MVIKFPTAPATFPALINFDQRNEF